MSTVVLVSRIYKKLIYLYEREEEKHYLSLLRITNGKVKYPCVIIEPNHIIVGNNFYLGAGSRLEAITHYEATGQTFDPEIIIKDNVSIQGNCHIGAINKITIGNGVLMGNGVFITDHSHGNSSIKEASIIPANRNLYTKGIVDIGNNVWLCERVTVLPNVRIGDGAIIAAGAVVTSDIPSNCVAGGVPAKVVKYLV